MSYKKVWIPVDHLLALAFRHPAVQGHLRPDKNAKAYLDVDEETGQVTGVIVEEYDDAEVKAALQGWAEDIGGAEAPRSSPWWMWHGQPRPESMGWLRDPQRKRGLVAIARRALGLDALARGARMAKAKMRRSHTTDRGPALALLAGPPLELAEPGADSSTVIRRMNTTDLPNGLLESFPLVLERTARLRVGYRHPGRFGDVDAFILSYENRAALRG